MHYVCHLDFVSATSLLVMARFLSSVDLTAFGSDMPLIVGSHRGTAEHTDIASHRGRDANGVMSSERVEANRLSSYQGD